MNPLYKEPVGNTCPTIDNAKYGIDNIIKELHNISNALEEAREANSTLRDWGHDLVKHSIILEEQVPEHYEQVFELEDKINELESEVDSLHNAIVILEKRLAKYEEV